MGLEIKTINGGTGAVYDAAVEADKKGKTSYNGALDEGEICIFFKKGAEKGCSREELYNVATKVVSEDSEELKQALSEYDAIAESKRVKEQEAHDRDMANAKLKSDIKDLEQLIREKEKTLKNLQKEKEMTFHSEVTKFDKNAARHESWIAKYFLSGAIGLIGGVLAASLVKNNIKKAALVGIAAGLVIGALNLGRRILTYDIFNPKECVEDRTEPGLFEHPIANEWNYYDGRVYRYPNPDYQPLFKKVKNEPQNYNDSVNYNRAKIINDEQILPLEEEIKTLKQELERMKQEKTV